ncbi:MAG: MurR/RpiR family transcriptional regulator [Acidimicrobiia bacterium]|nr:MurR/RpiR family transcriptional regulator [Acidimicrobiia bacterium]
MEAMPVMSPQVHKAAAFVLDHPDVVGFASVRQLAADAGVKPNTLVRMARAIGFDGYEDFRETFRDALRTNPFPDRAEWLQDLAAGDRLETLYADIAGSALSNLEQLFAKTTPDEMRTIADLIVGSRRTYVIGVGANYALAHNFAYLVGMALDNVTAVPQEGNLPMDAVVRAGRDDVVVAMTFEPYRSEVVDAVTSARAQKATVVAITDSHGSPIAVGVDHVILTPSATPQFFPSTIAAAAALETLASFIVADAPRAVVQTIERFHRRRYDLGVYWSE